jgi:hypothetical protein
MRCLSRLPIRLVLITELSRFYPGNPGRAAESDEGGVEGADQRGLDLVADPDDGSAGGRDTGREESSGRRRRTRWRHGGYVLSDGAWWGV